MQNLRVHDRQFYKDQLTLGLLIENDIDTIYEDFLAEMQRLICEHKEEVKRIKSECEVRVIEARNSKP